MPRLALIAGLGALGVMGGVLGPPMLHPHPSGSTDRVTPGAVRVESESHVSITYYDDRSALQKVVREYEVDLAKGSGFTVTPDGVIVTATSIVRPAEDVRIYAANKIFAEYHKVSITADFVKHTISDPDLNLRLQSCYTPQSASSKCEVRVTTKVTAFPYLNPAPPEGLEAEILSSGDSPAAPAILKVNPGPKANLPTVPLGTIIGTAVESVDVMTLAARPGPKAPPKMDTAHFEPPGSRSFKQADRAKVEKLVTEGAIGAAVIDDGKSEVVALLAGGGGLPATVTPVDEIRSALVAAGITPRRGPVDVVYENALASYHNKLFANAAPVLQQVVTLRPDHAVALDYLSKARAKAGTAEDAATKKKTSPAPVAQKSSGVSIWVWIAGGVVLAGALVAGAVPMVLRRRRAEDGEPVAAHAMDSPGMITSWPARTEVFQASSPPGAVSTPPFTPPPGALQHGGDPSPPQGTAQKKFCTQCGMRLGHAHRFCGFCGHPSDMP